MQFGFKTHCLASPLMAVALLATSLPVWSADSMLLTGAEGDGKGSFAYLATVLPIGSSTLGNGHVQRYWLDRVTYEYTSGSGTIQAEAWGAEAALGYQQAQGAQWWAAYAGVYYKETRLSPDDFSSASRGGNTRLKLQLEGESPLAPDWKANGNLSYVTGQKAYWARLRLFNRTASGMDVGPEIILQGDPDYTSRQVGLVFSRLLAAKDKDLALKIGSKHTASAGNRVYLGVEFSRTF